MADKVWTEAQRALAADRFSGRMMWTQYIVDTITIPCGDRVTVLRAGIEAECELTAKDAELAEAVDLLTLMYHDMGHLMITPAWQEKRRDWLKRNAPQEASDESRNPHHG